MIEASRDRLAAITTRFGYERFLDLVAMATLAAAGAAALALHVLGNAAAGTSVLLFGVVAAACLGYGGNAVFGGALSIVVAGIAGVYAIGLLDRELPILGTNVSDQVQVLVACGTACFVTVLLVGARVGPARAVPVGRTDFVASSRALAVLAPISAGAILVAVVNYATGDIPLLSSDVNSARLNGDYGLLGRAWPLVLPTLQVTILVGVVLLVTRRLTRVWIALLVGSVAVTVLNGGRSLIVIALLAAALVVFDLLRPRAWIIASLAALGAFAFGLVGMLRTRSSGDGAAASAYLAERNLDGWLGSLDMSLQTGPRVFSIAVDNLQGRQLGGSVIAGDMLNFLAPWIERSDRVVTEVIGRDTAVVGGMPPTVWGGFFLDFGWVGLFAGAAFVAAALLYSRRLFLTTLTLESMIWFGYLSAYVLISAYSYVSVRPSWVTVLALCAFIRIVSRSSWADRWWPGLRSRGEQAERAA